MLNCVIPVFEESRHLKLPITGDSKDLAVIKIRLVFRLQFFIVFL